MSDVQVYLELVTKAEILHVPYLLDQTDLNYSLLSNCRHTFWRAERNSCCSQILATANIRVAHAHVNKARVLNGNIKWVYTMGTRMSREVWGMEGNHRVKSLEENKETDWRCRVGTAL